MRWLVSMPISAPYMADMAMMVDIPSLKNQKDKIYFNSSG